MDSLHDIVRTVSMFKERRVSREAISKGAAPLKARYRNSRENGAHLTVIQVLSKLKERVGGANAIRRTDYLLEDGTGLSSNGHRRLKICRGVIKLIFHQSR